MAESTVSKVAKKGLIGMWMDKRKEKDEPAATTPTNQEALMKSRKGLADMAQRIDKMNRERDKK